MMTLSLLLLVAFTLAQLHTACSTGMQLVKTRTCPKPSFTKPPAAQHVTEADCVALCQGERDCIGIHHSPSGDCSHMTRYDYWAYWSSSISCSGVTFVKADIASVMKHDAIGELQFTNCSMKGGSTEHECSVAIDGNTNGDLSAGSCTHGYISNQKLWWQATTTRFAAISSVKIYNRDALWQRLDNFELSVDGVVCAEYNTTGGFGVKEFDCKGFGRTIKLQSRKEEILTICELIAYGVYI